MYIKRVAELRVRTCREEIAMKVAAAVLFAVVVAFAISPCCGGHEQVEGNAAKGLSSFSDSSQKHPLSKRSLDVIATSTKWLEGVISESRRTQSHVHDRIKKAFEEMKKVQPRTRREINPLVSCLTDAGLSAIDKACDNIASKWVCHTTVSALRVVANITGIADGNVVQQLICNHLGELTYDAGRFLHQLVCEWATAAFDDNPFVGYIC